jgi:hypothetical protein
MRRILITATLLVVLTTLVTAVKPAAPRVTTAPLPLPEKITFERLDCRTALPAGAFAQYAGPTRYTPKEAALNVVFKKVKPSVAETERLLRSCISAAVDQKKPTVDLLATVFFSRSGREEDEDTVSLSDGSDHLLYQIATKRVLTWTEHERERKAVR